MENPGNEVIKKEIISEEIIINETFDEITIKNEFDEDQLRFESIQQFQNVNNKLIDENINNGKENDPQKFRHCEESFSNDRALKEHMKAVDENIKIKEADNCNEMLSVKQKIPEILILTKPEDIIEVVETKKKRIKKKLKVEIFPDDNMKEIVCEICGFVGKDNKQYNKHFSRHKYCHKCGALFEGRFLKRHISRCGVIKPEKLKKKFECFKCHKKFDFKSHLTHHSLNSKCSKIENPENFAEAEPSESMETTEKSLTEENSAKEKDFSETNPVLESENSLMELKTVEKNVKEENYVEEKNPLSIKNKCDFCQKCFSDKSNLKKHIKVVRRQKS